MFSLSKAATFAIFVATAFAAPAAELDVEARQLFCPHVKVFFARGTTEVPTLGLIVGPPFSLALKSAIRGKDVDVEGLDYPALVSGYLAGGDIGGAIRMANDVTSIAGRCPNTKIVMSGYSQGAQVTHRAAARLSSSIQQRVVAVVTFGDPYEDTALPGVLQSRRKTFCAFGDLICKGQPVILPAHLGYGDDAPVAAAFVAARV
ncbi:cutinase [Panaeolus papilionaceus]|nr:cutinase [Panaeolus papilionaceus]